MALTTPGTVLTETNRLLSRYPKADGVETQMRPVSSWKSEFGMKAAGLPSRLPGSTLIISICPLFHRFKLVGVLNQTPPVRSASTDRIRGLDKPCSTERVATVDSRKRSRPLTVPAQMLPSRSSNSVLINPPESPCGGANASVLRL